MFEFPLKHFIEFDHEIVKPWLLGIFIYFWQTDCIKTYLQQKATRPWSAVLSNSYLREFPWNGASKNQQTKPQPKFKINY